MRGIVFDCDGVLVDSEKLSCGAWVPVLARHGVVAGLAEIERFIGKSDRAVLEHVNATRGAALGEEVIEERLQEYYRSARGRLRPFPGLHQALQALRGRGLRLAVASSGSHEKIGFALAEVGIEGFFEAVCSATEVSRGKPAPDLFLLAAARLGLPPAACAVIEDSVFGIQAARAAGMKALGFATTTSEEALREAGADEVFAEWSALTRLVAADPGRDGG